MGDCQKISMNELFFRMKLDNAFKTGHAMTLQDKDIIL